MDLLWNLFSSSTQMTPSLVSSFVGGGVISAAINIVYTGRRAKRDLALRLAEEYLARWDEIATAARSLAGDPRVLGGTVSQVEAVGNWLEVVATVYRKQIASRTLLDEFGLYDVVASFAQAVQNCKHPGLQEKLEGWINVKSFTTKGGSNAKD